MRNRTARGRTVSALDLSAYVLLLLAFPLLWTVSQHQSILTFSQADFVFFHGAVELVAVVVALLIFLVGYRAVLSARTGAVVVLGGAFLGVGLLDYLHILSYAGMPDALTPNSAHKSMFFWLAARLLSAMALLGYALWPPASVVSPNSKRIALAAVLALVGVLALLGLAYPWQITPLFVAGQGMTAVKLRLEWCVVALNVATTASLLLRRSALEREHVRSLAFAAALLAMSSMFFTQLGVVDTDGANLLGHIYKVAAYCYLFDAVCDQALRKPVRQLEMQSLRESTILDAAPDGILWVDETGTILRVNTPILSMTGFRPFELIGKNVAVLLPQHLRSRHGEAVRSYFAAPRSRAMGAVDLGLQRRDGSTMPVDISLGNFNDSGRQYAIAFVRDLTERKLHEESLRHQATHDELTGLPNRWLFHYQLDQAIARAGRAGKSVAVIFLDLDYFKAINDSFGHSAGDELLVQVGERIGKVLRENDILARLGGDEFAICLGDLDSAEEALHVADKILPQLGSAFNLTGHDVYSGASLGLSFFPGDANDSDSLLRFADLAMYQAKQAGRGAYACYSQEMNVQAQDDMLIHTRLKAAMAEGQLELHFQPQIDVISGKVIGAEALVRWRDSVLGEVEPERFLPIAESTGLILPLSDWVLRTACEQIAGWAAAGTPIRVSVNFSAQQFRQGGIDDKVEAALRLAGTDSKWLCVEITESIAMSHPELAHAQLARLAAKGCSISLDDFGTGYSSLAYLKSLPITQLKIDRSFMVGIPENAYDVAIARAVISLAHSLGITVVAEGVECQAQLAFLREHACEAFQGWLYAKAVPATQFQHFLQPEIELVGMRRDQPSLWAYHRVVRRLAALNMGKRSNRRLSCK